MANSVTIKANPGTESWSIKVTLTEEQTDISNNRSYVSWKVTSWSKVTWKNVSVNLGVFGTKSYSCVKTDTVDSGAGWVSHDSDGNLSISASISGTCTSYIPNKSASGSGTLTCQSITRKWTYSFNANGGTGAPGNQTKVKDSSFTFPSQKPTRNLYNFLGWASSSTATTAQYSAGQTVAGLSDANMTWYAVWKVAYVRVSLSNMSYIKNSDSTITVTWDWKADTSWNSANEGVTARLWYGTTNVQSEWSNKDVSISGTSGTVSVTTGTVNLDNLYYLRAEVYDKGSTSYKVYSYLDFTVAGNTYAMDISPSLKFGIGRAANDNYQLNLGGTTLKDAIAIDGKSILDFIYPVGSIFMSTDGTNPSNFLGGTWSLITDRVLIGAGNSYKSASTGGSTTHKHGFSSTGSHALTISEMPSHSHGMSAVSGWPTSSKVAPYPDWSAWYESYENHSPYGSWVYGTNATGGGGGHSHTIEDKAGSNMMPYYGVYMWRRTA